MPLKGINSCSITGTRCVTVKRDENQHTGSIRFVQHNQLTPLYCTFPKFFFRKRRYSWNIICVIGWQTEIVVLFLKPKLSFHFYLFLVCLPNHNSHSSKHSFSSQYITKRNTLRFGLWYYWNNLFLCLMEIDFV